MRVDDPIVGHYLTHSLVMRLATLSAGGAASITPIWFVMANGTLVATTAASTVAARNMAADPRVSVLLDGEAAGRSDYLLRLRGTAEVHDGLPPVRALARLARKYYLAPGGLSSELAHANRWRLRMRYYSQAEAVWLAITPIAAELVIDPLPRSPPSKPAPASRPTS